jgi:hypothetical protein
MREVLRDVQKAPEQDFDSGPISLIAARRFPPSRSAEETDACFIVGGGQPFAYACFEEELGRRTKTVLSTRSPAHLCRGIQVNR